MKPLTYQILSSLAIITILYGIVLASQINEEKRALGKGFIGGDYRVYLMKYGR